MRRRLFALLGCALAAPLATGPARAHPERPIRFIVGFGAGGTGDIVAGLVAQEPSAVLGHPVPVENRTGAGGNVAFEAAAKAEPDGHTAALASPAFAVNPALYGDRLRWEQEELAPVILLGILLGFTPVAVIVRPESPARDVGIWSGRRGAVAAARCWPASPAAAPPRTWPTSCSRRRRGCASRTSPTPAARRRSWT